MADLMKERLAVIAWAGWRREGRMYARTSVVPSIEDDRVRVGSPATRRIGIAARDCRAFSYRIVTPVGEALLKIVFSESLATARPLKVAAGSAYRRTELITGVCRISREEAVASSGRINLEEAKRIRKRDRVSIREHVGFERRAPQRVGSRVPSYP